MASPTAPTYECVGVFDRLRCARDMMEAAGVGLPRARAVDGGAGDADAAGRPSSSDAQGFVVGLAKRRAAASRVVEMYASLDNRDRARFMTLFVDCAEDGSAGAASGLAAPVTRKQVEDVCRRWRADEARSVLQLRDALVAPWERFVQFVSGVNGGVEWSVDFRRDVRYLIAAADSQRKRRPGKRLSSAAREWKDAAAEFTWGPLGAQRLARLRDVDVGLRSLFATQQAMKTRRIDLASSELLRFMAEKEAVHPITSASDMRMRVAGPGRVVYGLFHPTMPAKPLVFVEVALCDEVVGTVDEILSGKTSYSSSGSGPSVAMFYSVTNTSEGLQGLQLASFMLFAAMRRISERWVSCRQFVTLSPLPGFRTWLRGRLRSFDALLFTRTEREHLSRLPELAASLPPAEDVHEYDDVPAVDTMASTSGVAVFQLVEATLWGKAWQQNSHALELLRPLLMRWVGRYLMFERRGRKAQDPVANFHVSNGAVIEQLRWMAQSGKRGMRQSFGIMVNYRYDLNLAQSLSSSYGMRSVVATNKAALLLQAMGTAPFFESLMTYARVYSAGEWIFRHRDAATDGLYFVSAGLVQIVVDTTKLPHERPGRPVVAATLRGGNVFASAESLLGGEYADAVSARAASEPCQLFFVPTGELTKALKDYPAERQALRREGATQLRRVLERVGVRLNQSLAKL